MKYIFLSFILLLSSFGFYQNAEQTSVKEIVCEVIVYMKVIRLLQAGFLKKNRLSEDICLQINTQECLQSIYNDSSILKNEFGSWQVFHNYLESKGMINIEGGLTGHTSLGDFKVDNPTANIQINTLFDMINNQCFNIPFDEMTDDQIRISLVCMSDLIDRAKQENICPSFTSEKQIGLQ